MRVRCLGAATSERPAVRLPRDQDDCGPCARKEFGARTITKSRGRERELSDELMIEAYLKAKWRCGVETVTTAGWEESKKGPLRPEAWRTTERRKRASGPLLFETRRHGWNNRDLACDFARNLAKQGIATWSDVTEWGTREVLTWLQMKRVYGLRDNTTEHSEYMRLAEQLERPEWAQLRMEWKWAVTQQSAHGQKTGHVIEGKEE